VDNTVKKILAGAAGAAVIAGAVILGGPKPAPMTVDELSTLVKVYDYEIKAAGGHIDLTNVRDNTMELFNESLLSRPETKSVTIDGKVYTPVQYTSLRSGLIDKAIKNTVKNLDNELR